MAFVINALTAPDSYTPTSTIEFPIDSFVIDTVNASIYWQVKLRIGTSGHWDSVETFMVPGSRVIRGDIAGVRFRAAIPAAQIVSPNKQAVVTIHAE